MPRVCNPFSTAPTIKVLGTLRKTWSGSVTVHNTELEKSRILSEGLEGGFIARKQSFCFVIIATVQPSLHQVMRVYRGSAEGKLDFCMM